MTHPTTHQLEQRLAALLALLQDDVHAMTFQSVGQYRAALILILRGQG